MSPFFRLLLISLVVSRSNISAFGSSGYKSLLKKALRNSKISIVTHMLNEPPMYEFFSKLYPDQKTVEFVYGRHIGVPLKFLNEVTNVRMIFNADTKVDIPTTLAYPGVVLFLNHPMDQALESVKGFQVKTYILYTRCFEINYRFRQFWQRKIFHVKAICVEERTIKFYSMDPYNRQRCNSFEIVPRGIWNRTYSRIDPDFFDKGLTLNLKGCWIQGAFLHRAPGIIGHPHYRGWELDVLEELFEPINGRINATIYKEKSDGISFIREKLKKGADIVGGMIYNPFLRIDERGVHCGLNTQMTWLTRKSRETTFFSLRYVIFAMPLTVICLLILAYAFVIAFYILFLFLIKSDTRKWSQYLGILFLMTNQPTTVPNLVFSSTRLQFAAWSFFALILSCYYQALLKTQMTLGDEDIVLQSLEDLLTLNMTIVCKISYYYANLRNFLYLKEQYAPLRDNIIFLKDEADIVDILHYVSECKDLALLEKGDIIEYGMQFLDEDVRTRLKIHTGIAENVITPFIISRSCFFGHYIKWSCLRFVEAGLLQNIQFIYKFKAQLLLHAKESTKAKPLNILNVSHSFYSLFRGLSLAFSTFLCELLYYHLMEKLRLKRSIVIAVVFVFFVVFNVSPGVFVLWYSEKGHHHKHADILYDMNNHVVGDHTWWKEFL